jgi:uncharacterized protein
MHESASPLNRIFKSLFKNSRLHLKIMKVISKKRHGISRNDLLKAVKVKTGGWVNDKLSELEVAGFIKSFTSFGKVKEIYYKIIDEYSLFYLKWIEPTLKSGHNSPKNYWNNISKTPSWFEWSGYAFERVCEKHIEQIRTTLDIDKINSLAYSWKYVSPKNHKKHSKTAGAQIDLLFDRDDNAISLCEIKYSNNPYVIDKGYAKNLINKQDVFVEQTQTKKQIFIVMITIYGIKDNFYSNELINSVVILDDLFKEA